MGDVLKRGELGLFTAIIFAIGNMVGAGVFVLSGLVIQAAGPAAIFSYIICGILVMFSGLSYAALASIYPEDGGGYLFTKRLLGPLTGFVSGWAMYISLTIAGAFVLLGFGIYLNLLFNIAVDPRIFALIGLVAISLLNLRGISEAGKFETGLVVAKVAILAALRPGEVAIVGGHHREEGEIPAGRFAAVIGIGAIARLAREEQGRFDAQAPEAGIGEPPPQRRRHGGEGGPRPPGGQKDRRDDRGQTRALPRRGPARPAARESASSEHAPP